VDSFFVAEEGGFRATELTRGPWHLDFQHGGPPAALLARAMEALVPDGMVLARVTVEFTRPVKIARVAVNAQVLRAGRKVQTLAAAISVDGVEAASARGLAMRTRAVPVPAPPAPVDPPLPPAESEPADFYFFRWDRGYHRGMEVRLARGKLGAGSTRMWMRMAVPLVAGETPSPWQRVLCAADSGNGVSFVLDPTRTSFVNPDLTVALHRLPTGEWVCLDAATDLGAAGMGIADARLWDEAGSIGRGVQTLLVEPVG
jgi:hypothetical protein